MLIARTLAELQTARAKLSDDLGLVPTMGALHEGHLALLAAAKSSCRQTCASIFVNPLQFGPHEDFSAYPRTEEADLAKLEAGGCDLVWMPAPATMYPTDAATTINLEGPALGWEGERRPGHFAGVATVVAKLFGQTRPRQAFFGEKDWQQIQVISRMVADIYLSVEIIAVPTVREADGLALSSRNQFLKPEQRACAPALHQALQTARQKIIAGGTIEPILAAARDFLGKAGLAADYFALVHAVTLVSLTEFTAPARLIAAARLGAVRLLDNMAV